MAAGHGFGNFLTKISHTNDTDICTEGRAQGTVIPRVEPEVKGLFFKVKLHIGICTEGLAQGTIILRVEHGGK